MQQAEPNRSTVGSKVIEPGTEKNMTSEQLSNYKKNQKKQFEVSKEYAEKNQRNVPSRDEITSATTSTTVGGPSHEFINQAQAQAAQHDICEERMEDVINEVIMKSFRREDEFNIFAVHKHGLRLKNRDIQEFKDNGLSSFDRQRNALELWRQWNGKATPGDLRQLVEKYLDKYGREYSKDEVGASGVEHTNYGTPVTYIQSARKVKINTGGERTPIPPGCGPQVAIDRVHDLEIAGAADPTSLPQDSRSDKYKEELKENEGPLLKEERSVGYMQNVSADNLFTQVSAVHIHNSEPNIDNETAPKKPQVDEQGENRIYFPPGAALILFLAFVFYQLFYE